MALRKLPAALAAVSLVAAPVAAQAAPAPTERASAPAGEESELRGRFGAGLIIAALAAIGMLYLILDDNDDDSVSA